MYCHPTQVCLLSIFSFFFLLTIVWIHVRNTGSYSILHVRLTLCNGISLKKDSDRVHAMVVRVEMFQYQYDEYQVRVFFTFEHLTHI